MARILIVDDDERLRPLMNLVLQHGGHTTAEARDGDEALRRCAAESFDAVLCDVLMPGREGLETIRELRRTWPAMPVIAISGGLIVPALDPLRLAARLGACRTIAKPFRMNQLLAVVAEVLEEQPAATTP